MVIKEKRHQSELFYEGLQNELSAVIKFGPQEIQHHLEKYWPKPISNPTHKVSNSIVPTDVMLKEDGTCISVIQRTYYPLSTEKQSPIIQLIENYNPGGVNAWIPIYTHESNTSSGLFLSHTLSSKAGEIKTKLVVGLKSEGTKKIIAFIESQGKKVPSELKSSDREEHWCLTQRNGVWYAEEFYVDHNKADFSYRISDESLKELKIDNVPHHIKITNPAVAPTEIKAMIDGKEVGITMPSSIFSNKGMSLRNRILEGQLLIPIAIEIDGKRKKWSETEYNYNSS
jgi:hypothetical protein